VGGAACGPFIRTSRSQTTRPNILFLLADDQSYETLSITGNAFVKTPNIDRIGHEGVLFTNAFVAMSLCAPSRAAYLTGNYPHTNGIYRNQIRWNQQLATLPTTLHDAGYRTAHIGKFHMDNDDRVQPGYDYWSAQVNQGQYVNPRKNVNGEWKDLSGYDTDIVTDQAIEFMRSRKPGQPFLTWLGYKAVHAPFTPAPGFESFLAEREFKPPGSWFTDDKGKPDRVRRKGRGGDEPARKGGRKAKAQRKGTAEALSMEQWAERERNYYRALMGLEKNVGRLLDFLDEEKLAENTIVVFASDNGFFHGEHGLHGKLEAYEESLRVPMLARFPGIIRPRLRVSEFVANVDFMPTMLDFCGVKAPAPVEGRSWRPLVTGRNGSGEWRRDFLYEMFAPSGATPEHPTLKALRTDRYKLILNLNPREAAELYDLEKDRGEMNNLASEAGNRELVGELTRQMVARMREVGDPAIPDVEATLAR